MKSKNKTKFWWQKKEKDYNSLDRAVMEIECVFDYEDLPKWKKKLYDNLINKYYGEDEK